MKPVLIRTVHRQPKAGKINRGKKGLIFLPPRFIGKKVRVVTY